jgi:hypothetical protein
MASGSETSDPGMRRDGKGWTERDGRLGQPLDPASAPHPALIALARLLARSAAREAASAVSGERISPDDED